MTHAALKEAKEAHKSQLINEVQGKARFKTFRANNELYMRYDAARAPKDIDSGELRAYNALVSNLRRGSSLPSKSSIHTEKSKPNQTRQKPNDTSVRQTSYGQEAATSTIQTASHNEQLQS